MHVPESGSFYDLLGVSPDAGSAEIRAAFLRLAQRHHPDLNGDDPGSDRRFKQIRRVYEILSDPLKRAAYDESPERFRLSDADVIGEDFGTIVTRPVRPRKSGPAWQANPRASRAETFRPRWLADGRFGHESRILRFGSLTAMLTLSLLTLLFMRSHQAEWQAHQQARLDEPAIQVVGAPPSDGHSTASETRSPMDQVLSSVRDLRADQAVPAVEGEPEPPPAPAVQLEISPPSFDIVDELNLPFPGWPLIAPSPTLPDLTALPTSPSNDVNFGAPVIYSQAESVPPLDAPWSQPGPLQPQHPERPLGLTSYEPNSADVVAGPARPWGQTVESTWPPHERRLNSAMSGPPTLADVVRTAATFRTLSTHIPAAQAYPTSASLTANGSGPAAWRHGQGGPTSLPGAGVPAVSPGGGLPPFPGSRSGSGSYDFPGTSPSAASNWDSAAAPISSFSLSAGYPARSEQAAPVETSRPRDFGPTWNGLPMRSGSPINGAGAARGTPRLPQRWTPSARIAPRLPRP